MNTHIRYGRPIRVMHVITPSRMAGAETFLARLLNRANSASDGHRLGGPLLSAVHCVTSRSPANSELQAAGVDLEPLSIGGKANLLAMPRLAAAARRCRASLLHSHLSTASWWCGWLEFFGGPPSIGHVHGFTSRRWHVRQTHLIACSNAVRADLVKKGIRAERISVMHYPVDPRDVLPTRSRDAVRAELGVADDTPVVGAFAHLSLKKGYRELVRAAEVVLRRMPNAHFWCFGEGPLRTELEAFAQSAGIADRFRLVGFRRDAANYMHAIDVMCLPSHREPFGLVYVEAALAGKPVIACDAGGAPEIIEHGQTGLLVPPPAADSNVAAIADAIVQLLDDRWSAAAMGSRGRERALARFGWSNYLSRLNALYERVLGVAKTDPAVFQLRRAA
jgi:glycosyltransferase involved in cell wall biosynthesis